MPKFILVDDPFYKGPPPAPQMIRSWAMRRLFYESDWSVGDIARHYGATYTQAYKAIHPESPKSKSSSKSAAVLSLPLTPEAASKMPSAELTRIAKSTGTTKPERRRRFVATAEMDRRAEAKSAVPDRSTGTRPD